MAKMNGREKYKKDNKTSSVDGTLDNPAFELDKDLDNGNDNDVMKNEKKQNNKNNGTEDVDQDVLMEKDKQIEDLVDRLRRSMAEFDNFRKRTEKEKSQMYGMGEKNVLENLLPVIDNFERALSAISEDDKSNSYVTGIDMIYKQLMTSLESLGAKEIEAVGKPFDPNLHNAVMHEENEEYGENIVVEQFLKGYMYKDTVLRYSMVKVAN